MTSIFYSKKEEEEIIEKNIKQLLIDRNININFNILSIIKNHQLVVNNGFLIGYLNDSKINSLSNLKNNFNKGIIIWDCNKKILPDEKFYNMNIDTFNKQEFRVNIVRSKYVPKHTVVDKAEVLKSYPNIRECDFPIIRWNDPIARYYGIRKGDMVRIERHSINGTNIYYRICK